MNTEQTAHEKSMAKLEEISKSPKLKKELKQFFKEESKKEDSVKKVRKRYFNEFDKLFKEKGKFE